MNKILAILIVVIVLVSSFFAFNSYIYHEKQGDDNVINNEIQPLTNRSKLSPSIQVTPIMHATAIIEWDNDVIYTDPTGGPKAFENRPKPSIILLTDIHGDHYSLETLTNILSNATIIAPQAVYDMLPQNLKDKTEILANNKTTTVLDFDITAVPMYNLPESADAPHTKGRGNGYVIDRDGYRAYVAGDTGPIAEMKSLKDIDMAFIPMNLPYTMSVEDAASAVLAFKPKVVYPYHYRGQDGLADVNRFKELVNAEDSDIEVRLENWYPN